MAAVFLAVSVRVGGAEEIVFNRDIRPLLSENCFHCHGPDSGTRKAGLRLDLEAEAHAGAIVAGDPARSELWIRITASDDDDLMPPPESGKALDPGERDLLRRWIESGAEYQSHWAFVTPERPAGPGGPEAIDHFVRRRLADEGLAPARPAGRRQLARRVSLDLNGLPPTPEEVEAFLADRSPQAYEKVVDRLLASPRFGEHMARHWLDAARYGDTHGLHLDNYREMWPYRDWVIRAFNRNMPYDVFLTEQLAGDLLEAPATDQLVATGFNRAHVTTNEGGSIKEEVFVRNVVDRVSTFGTVMLGLTTNCASCHDHKFDPVTQREFYQLFAYFNSLDGDAMDGNRKAHAPVVRVIDDEGKMRLAALRDELAAARRTLEETIAGYQYREPDDSTEAGNKADPARNEDDKHSKPAEYRSFRRWLADERGREKSKLPGPLRASIKKDPGALTGEETRALQRHYIVHVDLEAAERFRPLREAVSRSERELKKTENSFPTTLVWKELPKPRPAYVLERGQYDQRGEQVPRALPEFLPPMPDGAPNDRLGLARWLLMPVHPLTARVAVNRFWQQLFGVGLVKTAEDFGSQGEWPSHPQLLDWLAVEFRESGWDVKALLKTIVLSETYRQRSEGAPEQYRRDPENRLLARGPRFRLDAESLRDQALAVAGLLVEQTGGPPVKPPQPDGLWSAVGYSGSNTVRFKPDRGPGKVHRRSLYTFWKRTAPPPQMIDAPSRESCVVRRERTNTPLHALMFMNDPQYVEAARAFAERFLGAPDDGIPERLFLHALARPPGPDERGVLRESFRRHLAHYREHPEAARALVAIGDRPSDASDPERLAAWTMVASLMLNLDEFLTKN